LTAGFHLGGLIVFETSLGFLELVFMFFRGFFESFAYCLFSCAIGGEGGALLKKGDRFRAECEGQGYLSLCGGGVKGWWLESWWHKELDFFGGCHGSEWRFLIEP
jgi:hypothetical protein